MNGRGEDWWARCAGVALVHTARTPPCVCLQLTSGMAATVGALVGAGAVGTTAAGPAISAGAVGVCPMTWCVARICCSHIWWLIAPVDVMGGPLRNPEPGFVHHFANPGASIRENGDRLSLPSSASTDQRDIFGNWGPKEHYYTQITSS